jgi:DsbC/DsbD-like thiol-disulfide interchange protein
VRHVYRIAAVAVAFATLTAAAHAQLKKSDTVVKAEAKAGKVAADGTQDVTITLTIDKGWHLYANPVGNEDLVDNQVLVTLSAPKKLEDVKIEYPEGKLVHDKSAGDLKIYEGTVTIKASVRRAKGDTEPIDVAVKIQACDKTTCLVGTTVKLTAK